MIYKLFLYGEKKLFAYTEIMQDAFLKENDTFYFEDKKYKILRITRTYLRIDFDTEGRTQRTKLQILTDKEFAEKGPVPELIITEIPEV